MQRIPAVKFAACMFLAALIAAPPRSFGQAYLGAAGNPTFGVDYPVEDGFVNVANGNIHLEIPLSSYKQRGKQQLDEKLVYDGRIWAVFSNNGSLFWNPTNLPGGNSGWRTIFGQTGGLDAISYAHTVASCVGTGPVEEFIDFALIDNSGTTHAFPFATANCPSGQPFSSSASGYAVDGSGYYGVVTNETDLVVYDNAGNEVYPLFIDSNGNYTSYDANGNPIDTDGRTPVIQTVNGNVTTYSVLTVGGQRLPYTVTFTTVYYNTQFQEQDVRDVSGHFQAIQSIGLPDGTAYTFGYDSGTDPGHYGELTSVTLPTGGVISYQYENYKDSYQNENRWIQSRQDQFGTATFTPSVITQCNSNGTGCQEQVSVSKPSGDIVNYTFTLNNGAWNTQTDSYTSTYGGGASPVMTSVTNYDFSTQCDPAICNGAEYVQASSSNTTLNDIGQEAQTLYTFAQPWTGKPTKLQQWDYYPVGQQPSPIPTKESDITYGETVNGASLPTLSQLLDQNGNLFTETSYSYDQTAPVATSGIVNHQAVTGNRGNLTSLTYGIPVGPNAAQAQWNYVYDDTGTTVSVTDPNGYVNPSQHTTSFSYDPTDTYVTKTARPQIGGAQHISTRQFDASTGFITQSVDENGQATSYTYDSLGRAQSVTNPDGGSVSYTYPQPEIETVATRAISASVAMTQTTMNDPVGRPSQVTTSDPAGNSTVSYTYDGNGRTASVTTPERGGVNPTDGTESFTYDWLDRYSKITRADGNTVQYSYSGNTATVTGENGNKKEYEYDAFTNLSAVIEPDLNGTLDWETDYTHDPGNNLTSITQKGNSTDPTTWRVRSFAFDPLGRMIQETTPEAGTTNYGYDNNGNLVFIFNPAAYSINQTYDGLNRLTSKVSSGFANNGAGALNYSYSYDNGPPSCHSIGRLTLAGIAPQSGGGGQPQILLQPKNSRAYCYDTMGRLQDESWSFQNRIYTVAAGYDYAGDLAQLVYPDGRTVSQTFQGDDRVYNVAYSAWNGQPESSSYFAPSSYAPTGQITGATLGNGVQMAAGYNSRGSIVGLGYYTGASVLWANTYQWAANASNLQTIADYTGSTNPLQFSYDPLNRIQSVQGGGQTGGPAAVSESYTIDPWGNVQQSGNFTLNVAYTTANQLPVSDGYRYDGAGDLIADGSNTFVYDTDGRMILSNGADAYNYGADGHLAYSATAAGETDYLYLGDLLVAKYQPGAGSWTDMIYGDGSLIATVAGTQNAVPNYRLNDYLGSLAILTDGSGNVLESNSLLPYGQQLSGGTLDPFLFTGLERESDTGADRALYRQYDATEDRWLTPDQYHGSYDPTDPQSFNRYAYVGGRPTFYTDPSGLDGGSPIGIGGAVGGCSGAVLSEGANVPADIGCGWYLFQDILGLFGGPSFHGSLQPRASTNDPGSFGESLGIPTGLSIQSPGVAGALGLPTGDECEFGPCGPGSLGFGDGQNAPGGGTYEYQPIPPLLYPPPARGPQLKKPQAEAAHSGSYPAFLGCYYNSSIEQITNEETGEEPAYFAVIDGLAATALTGKFGYYGVIPVAGAALSHVGVGIKANMECSESIYGIH